MNLPSPHPGSFLKAPMPLPLGEGGQGRVRGQFVLLLVDDNAAATEGLRVLGAHSVIGGSFVVIDHDTIRVRNFDAEAVRAAIQGCQEEVVIAGAIYRSGALVLRERA